MRHIQKAEAAAAVVRTEDRLKSLVDLHDDKIPAGKLVKILVMHVRSIGQDELGNKLDEILLDAELVGCPAELPAN